MWGRIGVPIKAVLVLAYMGTERVPIKVVLVLAHVGTDSSTYKGSACVRSCGDG